LDDVFFQTEVLTELLRNLPEDARLPRLHKSLDWLLSGGLDAGVSAKDRVADLRAP
jgi:hypothetical protein